VNSATVTTNAADNADERIKAGQPIWPLLFLVGAGTVNLAWLGFLLWAPGRMLDLW
jgi:hypothetical protein